MNGICRDGFIREIAKAGNAEARGARRQHKARGGARCARNPGGTRAIERQSPRSAATAIMERRDRYKPTNRCRLLRRLVDFLGRFPGVTAYAFTPGFMLAARVRGLKTVYDLGNDMGDKPARTERGDEAPHSKNCERLTALRGCLRRWGAPAALWGLALTRVRSRAPSPTVIREKGDDYTTPENRYS